MNRLRTWLKWFFGEPEKEEETVSKSSKAYAIMMNKRMGYYSFKSGE